MNLTKTDTNLQIREAFSLNIPVELRERIKEIAKIDRRDFQVTLEILFENGLERTKEPLPKMPALEPRKAVVVNLRKDLCDRLREVARLDGRRTIWSMATIVLARAVEHWEKTQH